MLKIGQRFKVKIEDTNIFANGICRLDNMVVFVKGAITGEECEIEITDVYPKYAFATCKSVLAPSIHRVEPSCPYVDSCGGCAFSHLTCEFENEIKEGYVKSAFAKQHLDVEVEKIVSPVSVNYRNKVVLFYNGTSFGYMSQGTNTVIPHKRCLLNSPLFDEIASFTAKELKGTPLRALFLRKSYDEKEIMVCPIFFEKTNIIPYASKLVYRFPNVKAVLYGVSKEKSFALEKVKMSNVYGDGYINDTLCGIDFRISPDSFYQVNHTCTELLYEKAIELADLNKDSICADLFCGTGTIGIIAAKRTGATVYGVEIVESAVKDARHNAKANNIRNAHFEAMDASKFNKQVDTCIIDPPRKGCSLFMIETLKRLNPQKIVYVSCNTDTMTRDIKALSENYKISTPVSVFNLFPRTSHVESVVCLSRK
ncbi:MAG: 23S rRNA (uracil(1939)-C(5))-methyltransferase RlmD [Clostridia bacterium]|nr:23S rRNA (uracil(1939)-C(5))-methyltransferase RlmD [Clostridia bacterium]